MTVRESPRVDLAALRDLRRMLDATRSSPETRSSADREDDDEKDASTSTEFIPLVEEGSRDGVAPQRSDGTAQATGNGPSQRPRRHRKADSSGPVSKG